jgi:hypothetical protein
VPAFSATNAGNSSIERLKALATVFPVAGIIVIAKIEAAAV